MNQLGHEKSPYLLQHQHNPVDWLPWGEAAFARARAEDKPIFLSVGYSTCHWCHVMERESFENEAVAAIMNEHFINIKVDREEHPDVDRVYMTFIQAASGSGGWPMSVFLTPDLKPFYGGTYFPPTDHYGRPGFASLLRHLAHAWQNDRAKIEASGTNTLQALRHYTTLEAGPEGVAWDKILETCYTHFRQTYDSQWGGFGDAPKFPRPVQHDFLNRYYVASGETKALEMSAHTLRAMSDGGMNDQLGGGFHRYSVDEQWIVSHFEKMLYDQAQLVVSYLEMYQLTHDEFYAQTAKSVLEYVLRDMTDAAGGFYSAEDADSLAAPDAAHKEEGAFYVWELATINNALPEPDASIFCNYYGIQLKGNAPPQGDPHGEFRGKNILYRAGSFDEIAKKYNLSHEVINEKLTAAHITLFELRNQRPRPHLDDKIIVAWNGLMISAFAQAASILEEPRYLEVAKNAAEFMRRELFDASTGTLRRHYRQGAAEVAGFADDYAFLARGLLDLAEASFDIGYAQWAEQLTGTLNREFWDAENGGYYNAAPDPHVLLRMKEDYDGAEPSANSIATLNNLRLANLLERDDLRQQAERTLQVFSNRLTSAPYAMPELLCAQLWATSPPLHIVIIGDPSAEATRALLRVVYENFLPYKSVLVTAPGATQEGWAQRLPFVGAMQMQNGEAIAYVCRNFACQQPVTSAAELRNQLNI